ncbi:MAG: hypothetical protein HY866_12320 [Chloroflexi bacterium]|nr:hypothetical protein [Chloroflexota bacterium]
MTVLILICCICLSVLGACAPEPQTSRDTYVISPAAQEVPTLLPDHASLPALTPQPLSTLIPTSQPGSTVQYGIDAVLDWATYTLQVEQRVHYYNDTGEVQPALIFNVDVNQEPGDLTFKRITNASHLVTNYTLEDTRLTVPFTEPLAADAEVELILEYSLIIPQIEAGYRDGHLGYWGRSARQVNLGMWFPLVAAFEPSKGWITPASHWLGEHFVLRSADFVVNLTLHNTTRPVRVAGPGESSRPNKECWRFELAGGRELALSLSENFRVLSTTTSSGVKVELYYLADDPAITLDAPRHTLQTAADALALYEELYGAYPLKRLAVVEGDFPDGMEFSGLVFVSQDWFKAWKGIPNDWLTLITAHEVAHQWWYALVSSDQGHYPYIDETLAIYSEVFYIEKYYPDYLTWWWDFRVNTYAPQGYVDTPIYDFYSPRGYIDAVYLRGALMMEHLRTDLGDEAFLDWLQAYFDQMQGRIAYPIDLWSLLSTDQYAATSQTRILYLKNPDLLPQSNSIP